MSFSKGKKQTNVAADAHGKDKTTTTPPSGASIESEKELDPKQLATPVTSSDLDRTFKIKPSEGEIKDALHHTLFGYIEAETEAATLSAASEQLQAMPNYSEAFDKAVKSLLQHTAKCDYSIHVIEEKDKAKPIDIEEGILYLKKNPDGLLQYQFIPPDAKEPKKPKIGTITQEDLKDEIDENIGRTAYPIPERLTNDNVQQLLPKLFKVINHVPLLKAEQTAKQNYALILSKRTFKEEWCGQRDWKQSLSALQYAAWAGDTELVDKFLALLPNDKTLKEEALRQLNEVKTGQLGRKHLSAVTDLKNGYQEYDRLYKVEEAKRVMNWDQLDVDWVNNVGKNQLRSVVNLLQWYCSSAPFADSRQNNQPPLFGKYPEARSLALWDRVLLNLLSGAGGFGSSWSIYKGAGRAGWQRLGGVVRLLDFAAVSRFCEVRTNDLNRQIKQLEAELKHQPVDQKQVEKPPQLKK